MKQVCPGVMSLILVVGLAAAVTPYSMAKSKAKSSAPAADGQTIFQQSCASCHAGGGNSVNNKKPIYGSKKLSSLPTFKAYLENPLGHMPYYKYVVNDKAALKALYQYCKKLAPSSQS